MKVKPKKVTYSFCLNCERDVKFKVDWMGVKESTPKGIITYKELYAICPHCGEEIYVSAVNDVNVVRREKAFAETVKTQIQPTPIVTGKKAKEIEKLIQKEFAEEDIERGKANLRALFQDKEQYYKLSTLYGLAYEDNVNGMGEDK